MAYIPPNVNGQATMANSAPVTIASNQSALSTRLAAPQAMTTGTITTATSAVTATDLTGIGSVTVSIYGTYAGVNITFEFFDGTNWIGTPGLQTNSAAPSPTLTSGALTNNTVAWNVSPLLGAQQFRVRATAWTSGTANIIIEPSAQFVPITMGVTGSLSTTTTVTAITTGTGAANLGKAEDAAHATGDTGVATWGVRNDNAASTYTSANGDYSPHSVDTVGTQFVRDSPSNTATVATPVTAATASTQVVAANAARRSVILYNSSTSDCYVKYGTAASSTSFTLYVPSLATVTITGSEYAGIIHAIWIAANGSMYVTETSL